MKNERFDDISEEDFLKNKARRKTCSEKKAKKKKDKKITSPVLKWFLIALAIILSLIALVVIVCAIYYFAVISSDGPDEHNERDDNFINSEGEEVSRLTSDGGNKKYFTFLATATDAGGALTDVIMVARFHYDDKNPEVSIIQIPRDTYVKIASDKLYFTDDGALSEKNFSTETAKTSIKINEAYYRGKSLAESKIKSMLKETDGKSEAQIDEILAKKEYIFIDADKKLVKSYAKEKDSKKKTQLENDILRDFGLTYLQSLIYYSYGIPTDYHAQVNVKGFRGVVDAIDGVDLYVPQNMDYDDPYQDLHIHLKAGQQHLNGKKAEQFVRFRGYPEGDVARLDAQKLFIDAFLDKLLSFSTVTKLDDIITEIQSNLFTNISFNNMLRFANKLLLMDLENDIHIYTLPGMGEYIGSVSYFVADKSETITLINEEFNVFDSPLIEEDFRMVDNDNIYRPAAATEDEEKSVDEKDGENADGDEETDDENADADQDSKNTDDADEDDTSDGKRADGTDKKADSDKDGENTDDADEGDKNTDTEKADTDKKDVTADKKDESTSSDNGKADNEKKPQDEGKADDEQKSGSEKDSDGDNGEKVDEQQPDVFSSEANLTLEEDENYKLLEQMAA